MHAACYKHAAPLGLNTSSRIPVFNPAHLSILSVLIQTNGTCRPSGAKYNNALLLPFPLSGFPPCIIALNIPSVPPLAHDAKMS